MTNVLYFFDEISGSWYPMPLSWERHVPGVTSLISEVQVQTTNMHADNANVLNY